MGKPRVIIADTDINYIFPLQHKFAEEFGDDVDLEIICDGAYFNNLFSSPQQVDVLIVSEKLYQSSLQRHSIGNCFVMTERYDETVELNVVRLYKYTSIKEIFGEITGKCAGVLRIAQATQKEPQIILVTSACGGVGKTTVALGISMSLTRNYKRVLYIGADRLQTFQHMLENSSTVSSTDVYARLAAGEGCLYEQIKHVIRNEGFHYLPAFKAPLMSLGLGYGIFERLAKEARKSGDYDYIVVDADVAFDEDKASLIGAADKVVVVTAQTRAAVFATNQFTMNINGINMEKYCFICNNFDKEQDNALVSPSMRLRFSINEYIPHLNGYDQLKCGDLAKDKGVQKVTFLIM